MRRKERGRYDRDTINAILDEALICHVGFSVDGQPYVQPTIHARIGERLVPARGDRQPHAEDRAAG